MRSTVTATLHTGWYLPAFRSELDEGFTPLAIGSRRLMALREGGTVRVFDSTCPHRGANLAVGGRREADCVVCPFHGRKVHLGGGTRLYSVLEHRVALWGEAVFVRLAHQAPEGRQDDGDRGFACALKGWADAYPLVPALTRPVAAPSELIVENAFDGDHFHALHKVPRVEGMAARAGRHGELEIEGEFRMLTSPWQDEAAKTQALWTSAATGVVKWTYRPRFYARAFSPNVVVTEFGPDGDVHVIVTASVPTADGGCVARVAIGVTAGREADLEQLIAGSHKALGEDASIWENLDPEHKPRYDVRDRPVIAFREFCDTFGKLG